MKKGDKYKVSTSKAVFTITGFIRHDSDDVFETLENAKAAGPEDANLYVLHDKGEGAHFIPRIEVIEEK